MVVNVVVKSISKGANKLSPVPYDLPANINTVEELIRETAKVCLMQYRARMQGREDGGVISISKDASLEERAVSGKVVYGVYSHRQPPDVAEAVRNARDAFGDGVIAIFIDGKKMENLTDRVALREGSEVMFVKLTALSVSCLLVDWIS